MSPQPQTLHALAKVSPLMSSNNRLDRACERSAKPYALRELLRERGAEHRERSGLAHQSTGGGHATVLRDR